MSLPVNLSVAIRSPYGFRHIGDEIDDLSFGSTSPGGHDAATFSLRRPLATFSDEAAPFSRVIIYDTRSAETQWEGRLQDPGRTASNDGESYQMTAVGGQAHLQDDTRQLYLIENDMTRWDQVDKATAGSIIEQIPDYDNTGIPIMLLRIPFNTPVNPTDPSRVVIAHRGFAAAGQKIASVYYNYDCGLTSANITHSLYAVTEGVALADIAFSTTFNTLSNNARRVIGTNWTAGRNQPRIRFHYTGAAGNASADTWWLQLSDVTVRSTNYDLAGNEILTGGSYSLDTMLASDVVRDMLGRFMTGTFDTVNASIATTAFAIQQLTYPDGATPLKILEDMCALETAYTWHVWETNPANNKFVFEWKPWPTTVRYEADIADGFTAPASGNTLFNRAKVRWKNRGTIRVSEYTQTVAALTDAGFDRAAFIDLGDEAATSANAAQVGAQFLADHRYPTNAGRLVITRPIMDHQLGRMVDPWEIRAGSVIRVQGVESYPGALNADGRDGLSLFRVAAAQYNSSDNAVTLDLDTYSMSVSRALAAVRRRLEAARRR